MNTKFSFTLLAVLILLAVSLAVTTSFTKAPKSAVIPVTGISEYADYYQRHSQLNPAAETARAAQAPRLWSGEVFVSDNDTPDVNMNEQGLQCTSEDSLPRRYSGCVE
jgi:hypothetical protein